MSGVFGVDTDDLPGLISELAQLTSYANELLAQVEQHAAAIAGSWSGAGHESYQGMHTVWAAQAKILAEEIDHITTITSHAHGLYGVAADAATRGWY
ncbi:uncharacterized protein YukE [Arthrobacter sp. GAS37]|uniref:WXG100 family type VII secretion target n=1 Tax=Arthrobacter sp. GAS37 TaxID=3156261 RepID=UPI003834FD13